MGRTAKASSDTFAIREWAARLAARAGPRDYRGQLEQIYKWIVNNWRYVREPDEWIHGTPEALISHVMGVKYRAPGQDPTRVRVLEMPPGEKGWGDCDDVTTLVAAAARSIGMTPYFRVSKDGSGAHVACCVRTPTGAWVSVDPVGHPYKPFGWAHEAPHVAYFDLDGKRAQPDESANTTMITDFAGIDGRPQRRTSWGHYAAIPAGDQDGPRCLAVPMRAARLMKQGVVVDGTPAIDERGRRYNYCSNRDLWIDARLYQTRLAQVPENLGGLAERRRRRDRRARRRRKRRRFVQNKAKWFGHQLKEGRLRNAMGRVYSSPAFTKAAGVVGSAIGIPPQITEQGMKMYGQGLVSTSGYGRRQRQRFAKRYGGDPVHRLMSMAAKNPNVQNLARSAIGQGGGGLSSLLSSGGLASMFSGVENSHPACCCLRVGGKAIEKGELPTLIFADPARAAQVVAMRAKNESTSRRGLSGIEERGVTEMRDGRACFPVAPILSIAGVPGLYMGEVDVTSNPTPGSWYTIKRGDTLFGIAGKAFKVGAGRKRLQYARMINSAKANRPVFDPNSTDKFFPRGKISFYRRWSSDPEQASKGVAGSSYATIWIPAAVGDEPPVETTVQTIQKDPAPEVPIKKLVPPASSMVEPELKRETTSRPNAPLTVVPKSPSPVGPTITAQNIADLNKIKDIADQIEMPKIVPKLEKFFDPVLPNIEDIRLPEPGAQQTNLPNVNDEPKEESTPVVDDTDEPDETTEVSTESSTTGSAGPKNAQGGGSMATTGDGSSDNTVWWLVGGLAGASVVGLGAYAIAKNTKKRRRRR